MPITISPTCTCTPCLQSALPPPHPSCSLPCHACSTCRSCHLHSSPPPYSAVHLCLNLYDTIVSGPAPPGGSLSSFRGSAFNWSTHRIRVLRGSVTHPHFAYNIIDRLTRAIIDTPNRAARRAQRACRFYKRTGRTALIASVLVALAAQALACMFASGWLTITFWLIR